MSDQESDRLARELELRKRLQDALLVFSRGVSARSSLPAALETLCNEVAALLGTRRASVWLHDRQARTLNLTASSDRKDSDAPQSIGADDDSPVARALRSDVPELTGSGPGQCLAAPLRGWRRALGSLVLEGEPRELPREQYVDIVRDFAPQLSVAIENLQAVDEVIRRHATQASMEARLAPAEKLAAVGQFMAGIAHELNNPLQGVLGHVELLMISAPAGSTLRADLKRIFTDADRAAKIVRNLLVFAGARRASRRRTDMGRLVARTIAIRETTPNRAPARIETSYADGAPPVLGDAGLLQQALLNVLVNAEQAAAGADGGALVKITLAHADGHIAITVDDNGPGIPPETLPRIFEPFFTTKESGKGTGLGLAITAGIVHEHGGQISAGASPFGGASFRIELPAAE